MWENKRQFKKKQENKNTKTQRTRFSVLQPTMLHACTSTLHVCASTRSLVVKGESTIVVNKLFASAVSEFCACTVVLVTTTAPSGKQEATNLYES
jgi:hypothetical protein